MEKMPRIAISGVTFLLICIPICAVLGLYPHSIIPDKSPVIAPRTTASVGDFSFTEYTKSGLEKRFTIEGRRLREESGKISRFRTAAIKRLAIQDAKAAIYDNNTPISYIRSEKAVLDSYPDKKNLIDSLTRTLEFSGNVIVTAANGRRLTCGRLKWDNMANRIRASGDCGVWDGKGFLKADIVEADSGLKNYSLNTDKKKRLNAFMKLFL